MGWLQLMAHHFAAFAIARNTRASRYSASAYTLPAPHCRRMPSMRVQRKRPPKMIAKITPTKARPEHPVFIGILLGTVFVLRGLKEGMQRWERALVHDILVGERFAWSIRKLLLLAGSGAVALGLAAIPGAEGALAG